jgi:hypothetical protein
LPDIIPPVVFTTEFATGLVIVPLGATTMPVALTIEPSACTTEPAGTDDKSSVGKERSIGIGSNIESGKISPEDAIKEPSTGFLTVPAGATSNPKEFLTEPSLCTTEPGGIDDIRDVDKRPIGKIGGTELADTIFPDPNTTEFATGELTVPAGATTIPRGLIIEPSDCTFEPEGIGALGLIFIVPTYCFVTSIVVVGTIENTELLGTSGALATTASVTLFFTANVAGSTSTLFGLIKVSICETTDPGGARVDPAGATKLFVAGSNIDWSLNTIAPDGNPCGKSGLVVPGGKRSILL